MLFSNFKCSYSLTLARLLEFWTVIENQMAGKTTEFLKLYFMFLFLENLFDLGFVSPLSIYPSL